MRDAARLLAPPTRAHKAAALTVALAGSWILDAGLDALIGEHGFAQQLLHPTLAEVTCRLLIAVLATLLYRASRLGRRLHLFSSAVEEAPDGIQITTLAGRVAYSNRAVRAIYGFSPEELLGRHVNDMNADPTFASRVILPALQRDGRWEGEIEVKHKAGHTFPIWLAASVVTNGRRPLAAIGVIRDVSERKRAEEELRSYAHRLEDATRLKDLFADILRHDLLGPAATVQLSLDAITRREPEPDVARRMLASAQRSCAKLIAMIEGAAKYAKLSAAAEIDFSRMDLAEILRELVSELDLRRIERNARLTLDAPGPYFVRANPMIADAFENLVSNALKYGGGDILVEVRDDGDRWRVAVADRGEGIPDEDKQKLFTRFERLRKEGVKGTGLGLAIVKRIVDLHGGSVWVEDRPGGGSVFCIALRKVA